MPIKKKVNSKKKKVVGPCLKYVSFFFFPILQLLRVVTELQILGEISFNKSLYEGLNTENHRTKVIPGCFLIFWVLSWEACAWLQHPCTNRHLLLPSSCFSLTTSALDSATSCLHDLELLSFCLSFSVSDMRQLNKRPKQRKSQLL